MRCVCVFCFLFLMKQLKILIVKVAEFGNLTTKKHWQTEVLYYVFWSILSQMRHVCCETFPKKIVPKFVCSIGKFSIPAIIR